MDFQRAKVVMQIGEGEERALKIQGFSGVAVDGRQPRSPLLVFEKFASEEIRWIADFTRLDDKTVGYKNQPEFDMTAAQAEKLKVSRTVINAHAHEFTLIRFKHKEDCDSFWESLRPFVGEYFMYANNPADRRNENFPHELLQWRKDFIIWNEIYQDLKAVCLARGSDLPTLQELNTVYECVDVCYQSVVWGWHIAVPHESKQAYYRLCDRISMDKTRIAINSDGQRRTMDEYLEYFEFVMQTLIQKLTDADV